MKYTYKAYCPDFKVNAQNEINKLRKIFPNDVIEHFGSTAIPGVGGKGIIDLYLAVPLINIDNARTQLNRLGYEYKDSGGVKNERWFYQQDKMLDSGQLQRFHLHLTYLGNENMLQCLRFRDYLRKHPFDAKEYSNIKHKAVEAVKKFKTKADKKKAYMDTKQPVIHKILTKMIENENTS